MTIKEATYTSNLPKLINRTGALPVANTASPGRFRYIFPEHVYTRTGLAGARLNRLFKGSLAPSLEECIVLGEIFGFTLEEMITLPIPLVQDPKEAEVING